MGLEIGPGNRKATETKKAGLAAALSKGKAESSKTPPSSSAPPKPSPQADTPKTSPISRLDQNPDALPSNSEASREIVAVQGSTSRKLIGKVKKDGGSESSGVVAQAPSAEPESSVEPQVLVHPEFSVDSTETANDEISAPEEPEEDVADEVTESEDESAEVSVEPQILVHPDFSAPDLPPYELPGTAESSETGQAQILVHPDFSAEDIPSFDLPGTEERSETDQPQILVHPDFSAEDIPSFDLPSGGPAPGRPPAPQGPNSDLPSQNSPTPGTPVSQGPNSDLPTVPAGRGMPPESEPRVEEESSGLGGFFGDVIDKGREFVEDKVDAVVDHVEDYRAEAAEERAQFQADVQTAYDDFAQNPEELATQIGDEGFGELSDAQRYAVVLVSDQNEGVRDAASEVVVKDVENFESFNDIPSDIGSQFLLETFAGEEEQQKLGGLVTDHLTQQLELEIEAAGSGENALDGDDQANAGVEELGSITRDLVDTHPALRPYLEASHSAAIENSSDLLQETARNDDGLFSRTVHRVTGWVRDKVEEEKTKIRGWVESAGDFVVDINLRGGEAASQVVDFVGNEVAEDFDQLGADRFADGVRGVTDRVSDEVVDASEIHAENARDTVTGVSEGVISAGYSPVDILLDPVSTAEGVATIAQTVDPVFISKDVVVNGPGQALSDRRDVAVGVWDGVTSDIRATNAEHGATAAAAHGIFDIATTLGTGGTTKVAQTTVKAGSRLSRATRTSRGLDEVATVGRLDDLGDAARIGDNAASGLDDLAPVADDAFRVGDDAGRLGDEFAGSADETVRLGDDAARATDDLAGVADDIDGLRALDADEAAETLGRTRVSQQVAETRGLDGPQVLDDLGLGPQFRTEIDGRDISFSRPFRAHSRDSVIAYIEDADGVVHPRTLYRSGSQANWRVVPDIDNNIRNGAIHKGPDGAEFSTELPIDFQRTLHELTEQAPPLNLADEAAETAFNAPVANIPFDEKVRVRDFHEAVDIDQRLGSGTPLGSGSRHTDPSTFKFDNPEHAPDFQSGPLRQFDFNHPEYGQVSAHTFGSADESLEFLFLTDDQGRSWIGQVDNVESPLNDFGVRSQPVDAGPLTTPAQEAFTQIAPEYRPISPERFEELVDVQRYFDNSRYVNELPPVRDFNEWLAGQN